MQTLLEIKTINRNGEEVETKLFGREQLTTATGRATALGSRVLRDILADAAAGMAITIYERFV